MSWLLAVFKVNLKTAAMRSPVMPGGLFAMDRSVGEKEKNLLENTDEKALPFHLSTSSLEVRPTFSNVDADADADADTRHKTNDVIYAFHR